MSVDYYAKLIYGIEIEYDQDFPDSPDKDNYDSFIEWFEDNIYDVNMIIDDYHIWFIIPGYEIETDIDNDVKNVDLIEPSKEQKQNLLDIIKKYGLFTKGKFGFHLLLQVL